MKILKNKKCLASIAAILVALALIAGSTMAWFVLRENDVAEPIDVGFIDVQFVYVFPWNGVDFVAQPGDMIGASKLFFNDPAKFGLDTLISDADLADLPTYKPAVAPDPNDPDDEGEEEVQGLGYIENTGNLAIVIQLNTGVNVERYYEDPNGAFPSEAFYPSAANLANPKRADLCLNEVPGYPGVDGAVIAQMIIPYTPNNQKVIGEAEVTIWQDKYTGIYYLTMNPDTKLDVSVYLDLQTNARTSVLAQAGNGYAVNPNFDPTIAFEYFDGISWTRNNAYFLDPNAQPFIMTDAFWDMAPVTNGTWPTVDDYFIFGGIVKTVGNYRYVDFGAAFYRDSEVNKYLDNTYFNSKVNVDFGWVATQGNHFAAWQDIFGATGYSFGDIEAIPQVDAWVAIRSAINNGIPVGTVPFVGPGWEYETIIIPIG